MRHPGSVSAAGFRRPEPAGRGAEERLAQLIGTAAVAPHPLRRLSQLKETLGICVGVAGDLQRTNPSALPSFQATEHDRLVERLQAGADLGVQSAPFDLAVLGRIRGRWGAEVFTAGRQQPPHPRCARDQSLATSRPRAAAAARNDLKRGTSRTACSSSRVQQAVLIQAVRIQATHGFLKAAPLQRRAPGLERPACAADGKLIHPCEPGAPWC